MTDAPKPKTRAQHMRDKIEEAMGQLLGRQAHMDSFLKDMNIDPQVFMQTVRQAISANADLLDCDRGSLLQACMKAAQDGLLPDGRKAAFVPFKGHVQYMPMYQGMIDVAYGSGNFKSIEAQVVYKGDTFEFRLGDRPFIRHTRSLEADHTEIIGAYGVTKTRTGGVIREVLTKADIRKITAVSRARSGPNKDWPEEMARKGALRRMWKWLPKTPAMDQVLRHDDDLYEEAEVALAEPQRLHAGFSTPALTDERGMDQTLPEMKPEPQTVDQVLDGDDLPADLKAAKEPEEFMADPVLVSLAGEADALEEHLRAQTDSGNLQAAWANKSGLRAELKKKLPERMSALGATFDQLYEELTR